MSYTINDLQRVLKQAGLYHDKIDGLDGPKTRQAVTSILTTYASVFPTFKRTLTNDRRRVLALQQGLELSHNDIDVGELDGFFGPSTGYALDQFNYLLKNDRLPAADWRSDDHHPRNEIDPSYKPKKTWPHQANMTRFFGEAGGSQCTAGKVNLPFSMRLAWDLDTEVNRFSCHEKVADSMTRVYNRIASEYSPEEIIEHGFDLFGGCYNFRRKRGGKSLSTHAYGIAVDTDPMRNKLRWNHSRAYLARPKAATFISLWEEEGFVSLGKHSDFDWMHMQAARL